MKQSDNRVESTLLRRINERRLLEAIQRHGPSSRAALTRVSGLTAPTVSKAVDTLLKRGLVEELDPAEPALGRPGRLVRMAAATACVVGVVIDAGTCCVVATGLDGVVTEERTIRFVTPAGYPALLDAATGLGLGVMSGGRLLAGHSGMAGEVGHITVVPDGVRCGCGNRGCLETLATDAALVRLIGEKLGRTVSLNEVAGLLATRSADFQHEVRTVTEYLAIAIAAVINIFNPTTLFVHGELLTGSPERFARVLERVRQRTLTASLADCTIVATKSSKRQGAVAGIIHHLTNACAPSLG